MLHARHAGNVSILSAARDLKALLSQPDSKEKPLTTLLLTTIRGKNYSYIRSEVCTEREIELWL